MTYLILIIAIIIITLILYFKVIKNHKTIKSNSILVITGANKTGKSFMGIHETYKAYKKALFKWRIKNIISKYILQKGEIEKPLLYSNIPIKCKYPCYKLTKDHLERKTRLNYNSVVYIGEYSLVANSRLGQAYGIKNNVNYDLLNEQILFFTKLYGHETHGGGKMIIDSQVIADCHYNLKRSTSQYLYIHHNIDIPFFKILWCKELTYSDDNTSINANTEDIESGLKWLIIPKNKYYKMYDYCCYSILTDNLKTNNIKYIIENKQDMKANDIISFNNYISLKKGGNNEKWIKN